MIFNLMKPVPTTESATMYLYGHEADKTVTYNGVELPPLPEWDKEKYPYAYISLAMGYELIVASKPLLAKRCSAGAELVTIENTEMMFASAFSTSEAFSVFDEPKEVEAGGHVWDGMLKWANTDLYDEEGNLYMSATDPVTTYTNADVTINGVGYVGAVLPKIPEWNKEKYPHAYIVGNPQSQYNTHEVYFSSTPLEYAEDGFLESPCWFIRSPFESADYYSKEYISIPVGWTDVTETTYGDVFSVVSENPDPENPSITTSPIIWCNTDITYPNGTVFFESTEPIPVELVGYSYNGTVLPKLPEWDKEAYPYAYISRTDTTSLYGTVEYILWCSATPAMWDDNNTLWIDKEQRLVFLKHTDSTSFVEDDYSIGYVHREEVNLYLIWSNTDVMNKDETEVFLFESEPIPVYN